MVEEDTLLAGFGALAVTVSQMHAQDEHPWTLRLTGT
jgi:hypothetical protein